MDIQENQTNAIAVAWDFTPMAEYALAHAVKLARQMKYEIRLLHVVASGTDLETTENIRSRMAAVCNETQTDEIVCKAVVKEGSLSSAVADYVNQSGVQFVIMGTHGIKGTQRIFGSKALKVIANADCPFIVVQAPPCSDAKIETVLFPVDFKSENKEKLQWAIYLGRNFGSKIHLFKHPVTEVELQKKVNTNLNFAIRFLKKYNIEHEIHTASKTAGFAGETISFAESIRADMIVVITTKDINLLDYMFGAEEQEIIANSAKIPVMCMNPMSRYVSLGQILY